MCYLRLVFIIFFFKQKTAYEMRISDWSSDVCSSDLNFAIAAKNALKDEAETWLASTVVEGVPITEWACGSDDLYWRAFSHIERAEDGRKRRVVAAEAAEEVRNRHNNAHNTHIRDPGPADVRSSTGVGGVWPSGV